MSSIYKLSTTNTFATYYIQADTFKKTRDGLAAYRVYGNIVDTYEKEGDIAVVLTVYNKIVSDFDQEKAAIARMKGYIDSFGYLICEKPTPLELADLRIRGIV